MNGTICFIDLDVKECMFHEVCKRLKDKSQSFNDFKSYLSFHVFSKNVLFKV